MTWTGNGAFFLPLAASLVAHGRYTAHIAHRFWPATKIDAP
jgi:hypothetical protein